jgi:hypothetical protein
MTQLTREQEIEKAHAQYAEQQKAEKNSAWAKADKELLHQQAQSV